MLSNPKAAALIAKLEKLNKDVAKSGILIEKITPEQEYLIDKIIHSFTKEIRHIEIATPVLRLDRLKVFLEHLKTGKLSKKFELGYYTNTADYAILFPEHWSLQISDFDRPVGKYLPIDCHVSKGEQFFYGLTYKQYKHLFYSYNQNSEWGNVQITGRTGLPKFIENMEQFIDYFEKGCRQC
ncbi:hypothetical protein [Pedobacter zeae]|uniref:Uncharacterized protein n=1 Tax=Pedobacter zeae TaxID=1737356 RepID=A0A7W6KAR8_9SPHI|nr:hypothetical protein [Pedobacter zeae]MBB4108326.1 hypothetical protein [Pedobacter zeae]GGG93525.1 hypothetical protein GCM10007422_03470 [Pedobacter zeae]